MRYKPLVCVGLLLASLAPVPGWAENWIVNGDFETDQAELWRGGVVDRQTAHSGRAALRLDEAADRPGAVARYERPLEPNQAEPEPIMAAFWMRLDARRQTGPVRGGMTFRIEMVDGSSLSWYGPFELRPCEMGSWVYREQRWVPRAPVARIRPTVYLRGCEGSIWIDDLYLGPVQTRPAPPRRTVPLALTGADGRFNDWPRLEFLDFRPNAHVFHSSGPDQANLELTCRIDVQKTAPVYLSSASGSQYWTLYCPERKELAQIYTGERLDLSTPGTHTLPVRMCGVSNRASELGPGGYVFVTDTAKNFLIYGTEHPAGPPGSTTPPKTRYWDHFDVGLLSRHLGPSGVTAPFSLADLGSYAWAVSARADADAVVVEPTLVDARKNTIPLYGLELRAAAGDKPVRLEAQFDADGVPTGAYRGRFPGRTPDSVRVSAKVRLATPAGLKEEVLDQVVAVTGPGGAAEAEAAKLELRGWGAPAYELSPKAGHGPQSMARLVADARAAGVGTLLVHARSSKETLYPSRIARATTVGEWDVLKTAVAEGKKHRVSIYAAYILGIAQEADLEVHPEWAALDRNGKRNGWYCYTNSEVHAFHAALVSEIVDRYDVAGVSLDFCRPGGGCFCPRCRQAFQARFGKRLEGVDPYDSDWRAWQRDSITEYLRKLRAAMRRARPNAQMSGYVWARLGPDKDRSGQDWPRWLSEGIMDWVAVGQYSPSTPVFRAECRVLRTIADRALGGDLRRICPLLGVSYIQHANPAHQAADARIARHLQAARQEGLKAAGYFPFFSIRVHRETSAAAAELP